MQPRLWAIGLAFLGLVSCASSTRDEPTGATEDRWDSADGNPTHPTHSIMAEYAINSLVGAFPELRTYQDPLVKGANLELHDLKAKDPADEALRQELGGNNWAADRPEILWTKATASYAAGDKTLAYFYVGILLHYVQDMGVPAHAFHVIHQSSITSWDNIELLAFFDFHADMKLLGPVDPAFANPVDYVAWSGAEARTHWEAAFPGQTYKRTSFPQGYKDLSDEQWAFLRSREAYCTLGNMFALKSAVTAFQSLARKE